MIQKVTMYQAFCDGCGERNPTRRLFLNELILRNELDKNKWKVINGFLLPRLLRVRRRNG